MHHPLAIRLAMVSMAAGTVLAQTSENLPAFLSQVQSLATMLNPSPTTSSSSSSSSHSTTSSRSTSSSSTTKASTTSSPSSSSSSSPSSSSSSSSILAASATSASPSSTPGSSAAGIDSRTTAIIVGVAVPVGLIVLGAIIVLLFFCCRSRRRRRTGRTKSEMRYDDDKFAGNNNWAEGDNFHHGFRGNTAGVFGAGNTGKQGPNHDAAPLIGTSNNDNLKNLESGTYGHDTPNATGPVPPTPAQVVTRKPVPNRFSNGSAGTTVGTDSRHVSHDGAIIGAGAGALAGAAAMHHHDKNRQQNGNLVRPEVSHNPLSSHPHNQPPTYVSSGLAHNNANWRPNRPATPPFSPDDVGSMHRRSKRFSGGPTTGTDQPHIPVVAASIDAPTSSQRRSLQSRHSGDYSGRDPSRGPSRSPKRRSMSGGGELWEADSMFRPALSSRRRSGSGGPQYTATEAAPPLPTSGRYSRRDFPPNPMPNYSSPPHNKHLAGAQKVDPQTSSYSSNTDSSTSDNSYDTAAEVNSWEYNDPGRYPHFSNRISDSHMPLIPPDPIWNEGAQRRWSDGTPKSSNGFSFQQDNRRYSGGNGRQQRARPSNGSSGYYDDAGLVGRAL